MNRAWMLAGVHRRKFLGLAALGFVGLAGCHGPWSLKEKVQERSQVGEDATAELDASTTIGSKTSVGNTEPILVSGVGLVYNLPGTGSSAPPGGWRMMLEHSLKKNPRLAGHIRELLDDPRKTTSLVLVTGAIPPGARKGDPIDLQISLPDESKTTSLQGGILHHCELYTSDTTGNLRSMMHDGKPAAPSGDLKIGDLWAIGEGPILAGQFLPTNGKSPTPDTDADGRPIYKVGRIWGGAKVVRTRPYFILLNPGDQNPRTAYNIAERLNTIFHATAEPNLKVGEAKTKELILANVPSAYRHNHYRFLLVARQVPILPTPKDSAFRRKLEDELLNPETTLTAAVKLEALGVSSTRALRVGLESTSPWVRFAAAEALTYLGQTDGAVELGRLAEDHPALRAPALKALSSMDDAACTDRLAELMGSSDSLLRYGAFIALRLADENNPAVRGLKVNDAFYLHRVAPGSPGMIHLTSERRCEIVLFGDNVRFRGPFTLPVGADFTVHVPGGGEDATVTRIVKIRGDLEEKKLSCPPDVSAVLTTMGTLGAGYNEAVELIRRADRAQVLSSPVVLDAIPAELNIRQLAQFAGRDPTLAKANAEVAKVGVVRPELDASGFNLPPTTSDPVTRLTPPPPRPPLNREPGRIFGPKRHDTPAIDPGTIPAGGQ
jgi:HEAT repeat protein/flagellar P-ring protein FlgI